MNDHNIFIYITIIDSLHNLVYIVLFIYIEAVFPTLYTLFSEQALCVLTGIIEHPIEYDIY